MELKKGWGIVMKESLLFSLIELETLSYANTNSCLICFVKVVNQTHWLEKGIHGEFYLIFFQNVQQNYEVVIKNFKKFSQIIPMMMIIETSLGEGNKRSNNHHYDNSNTTTWLTILTQWLGWQF